MEQRARPRLRSTGTCGRSSTARAPAFQAGGAGSIPVARSSPPVEESPLNTAEKLILGAAGLLAATGGALAIAQPGDLGGDDEPAALQETTTTTSTVEDTTTTTALVTTTTGEDGSTSTTVEVTTTIPNSGIGGGGTPNGGADGVADTGMESMLGPGLALGALGLALGRVARQRTA